MQAPYYGSDSSMAGIPSLPAKVRRIDSPDSGINGKLFLLPVLACNCLHVASKTVCFIKFCSLSRFFCSRSSKFSFNDAAEFSSHAAELSPHAAAAAGTATRLPPGPPAAATLTMLLHRLLLSPSPLPTTLPLLARLLPSQCLSPGHGPETLHTAHQLLHG